ncbi:hypothetical protein F610DRAFT_00771 [Streptomyces sp. LaPpAH-199]|uniref:hypothetical protein n=1 Tax=Streptomyces TaxID=1883 RepID=UPI000884A23F|nr:hypothetical protein [Streptomyces sp. LaPpAH-199]MYW77477.1 hypothetical protein [Streptomyces sp. SID8369]SDB96790.1 hypothetical protein F610DRAFT_00771 [Streptomyces sp. LaPpAH-199]
MTDVPYAAAVTVSDGRRTSTLAGVRVGTRRLALRWLRERALILADAHGGGDPGPSPTLDGPPVIFHGSDAPDALRAWATSAERQDAAIRALESGRPALVTVTDPAVGLRLTLAGWPVRTARAVGDAI